MDATLPHATPSVTVNATPSRNIRVSTTQESYWLFDELFEQESLDEDELMEMDTVAKIQDVEPANELMLEPSPVANMNESFFESEFDVVPDRSEKEPPMAPSDVATPVEKEMFLKGIVDAVSNQFPELVFVTGYLASDSNNPVLTITQKSLFSHSPFGITSRVTITIQYKHYSVHVLMRLWREGEIKSVDDVVELCHIFGCKSTFP